MRKYWCIFTFVLCCNIIYSQSAPAVKAMDAGIAAYEKGDYQKAIASFQDCAAISGKDSDNDLLRKAFNNLGNSYSRIGQSEKALENYLLSLKLSGRLKDTLNIAKTTKNIGTLYEEQKDFGKALQYYDEAIALGKRLKDRMFIADCLNNMGVIYEQQLQYKKALAVYFEAADMYTGQSDKPGFAMACNNIAIVYKYLKDYRRALFWFHIALEKATAIKDQFMIAATQNNMGNVYALTGDYTQAIELCQKANATAKAIHASEIVIESYDGIADAYEKSGNYPEAIRYRKLYEKEKETFINEDRSGKLAEMDIKYQTAEKEDKIKLLQQQSKINTLEIEKQRYFIIGFLLLLFLIACTIYFRNKSRKLRTAIATDKTIRETEEAERLRIARDIHDDLGSGLSKINFLSEIIARKTGHLPEVKNSSASVQETAAKMIENMRDLIWALNPDNTTLANLVARMREYTTDYLEDLPIEVVYSIPENIPQTPITKESHRELFMILKETLNNISKHSAATKVAFQIALEQENFSLSIKDNGKGFAEDKNNDGNGLRNMQNRLTTSGGSVIIISEEEKGCEVKAILPLPKMLK